MKRECFGNGLELLAPQFLDPLFLAVRAAENVQRTAFHDPALHLLEEHAPHLFGHFGFGRARIERAKRIERREPRGGGGGGGGGERGGDGGGLGTWVGRMGGREAGAGLVVPDMLAMIV